MTTATADDRTAGRYPISSSVSSGGRRASRRDGSHRASTSPSQGGPPSQSPLDEGEPTVDPERQEGGRDRTFEHERGPRELDAAEDRLSEASRADEGRERRRADHDHGARPDPSRD